MTKQPTADSCFICGHGNAHALEEHHVVPRRYGGTDEPENLVFLCGRCHNSIEALYDDAFYSRLGVGDPGQQRSIEVDTAGTTVEAEYSKDRKIPPQSPHVTFEQWTYTVYLSDIRDEDVQTYAKGWPFDDQLAEYVESQKPKLLDAFEEQRQKIESFRNEVGEEVGDPPLVEMWDQHDLLRVMPYLKFSNALVANPVETEEEVDDVDSGGLFGQESRASTLRRQPESTDKTRIHCGYCHTVFADTEHSDMARHLRVRHGIRDPYESRDSTYHSYESTGDSALFDQLREGGQ